MRKGSKMSEKAKRKISEAMKGRKASEETKRKMSEAQKRRIREPRSEETKRKIRETLKGQIPWNKGKKTGQIPWNKGKHLSKETKKKISKGMKTRRNQEANNLV